MPCSCKGTASIAFNVKYFTYLLGSSAQSDSIAPHLEARDWCPLQSFVPIATAQESIAVMTKAELQKEVACTSLMNEFSVLD